MLEDLNNNSSSYKEQVETINYKGKNFRVNFEIMNIPKLQEIKNFSQGGYYITNRDKPVSDTWFAQLLELYYTSPLHGAILKKLHNKINFGIDDGFFSEISFDAIIFGGFAIEIKWNYLHTNIVEMKSLPFDKVRAGLVDKDTREIEYYMYSNDWFKTSYRKWYKLDKFSTNKKSAAHQIYYWKDGRQTDIYPKPYYNAALKYLYVHNELATYFSSLIKQNFVSNGILHLPNPLSEEEENREEALFVQENSGSKNAGGIIVTHGRMDEAPVFTPFNNQQDDGKYMFLPDYTDFQIVTGHQVPVQIILPQPGKLGGTDEYEFFQKQYEQDVVLDWKNKINKPYSDLKKLM